MRFRLIIFSFLAFHLLPSAHASHQSNPLCGIHLLPPENISAVLEVYWNTAMSAKYVEGSSSVKILYMFLLQTEKEPRPPSAIAKETGASRETVLEVIEDWGPFFIKKGLPKNPYVGTDGPGYERWAKETPADEEQWTITDSTFRNFFNRPDVEDHTGTSIAQTRHLWAKKVLEKMGIDF